MRVTYLIHIAAGSLALLAGYVALFAGKGGVVHRRSGKLFVLAMLTMCAFGGFIALTRGVAPAVNIPAAVVTGYLVITAFLAVRPSGARRGLDASLMIVALVVGATSFVFAAQALNSPTGMRQGMPAFPFVLFGTIGTLGGLLDLRMIRAGGLRGSARVVRHLWRMSTALFIAAMSFFLGQAKVIPEAIRIVPLLAVPVLIVLIAMIYWLWRVRIRRSMQGLVGTVTT